jgi:hypothetical protein
MATILVVREGRTIARNLFDLPVRHHCQPFIFHPDDYPYTQTVNQKFLAVVLDPPSLYDELTKIKRVCTC